MNQGVYQDVTNAAYHGGPGVSKSGLDLVRRSPLHYLAATKAREADSEKRSTPAQVFGTAFHTLLLEPEVFAGSYAQPFIPPQGALKTVEEISGELASLGLKTSGTKQAVTDRLREAAPETVFYQDALEAYQSETAGKIVLSPEDFDRLEGMRAAVMAHPAAARLLTLPGKAEQSVYWTDPETGVLCRCRPDFWADAGFVVDLKSTDDASLEGFVRSVVKYRYYVQAPFYLDGVQHATGTAPKGFVFIAVEKAPPYAVGVYELDEVFTAIGRDEYREDLAAFKAAEETGAWKGYGEKIQTMDAPAYLVARRLAA